MSGPSERGVTLLEILMAMLLLGLVAGGIMGALVFGRRVNWRSEGEIVAQNLSSQVAEELRLAITGASPNNLTLNPGIYVDEKMANAGAFAGQNPPFIAPPGAVALPGLNLPANFEQRYQINPGAGVPTINNHGDGRIMVVEDAAADRDGDGARGFDFNGDGITDMNRVRVRVQWTTPQS